MTCSLTRSSSTSVWVRGRRPAARGGHSVHAAVAPEKGEDRGGQAAVWRRRGGLLNYAIEDANCTQMSFRVYKASVCKPQQLPRPGQCPPNGDRLMARRGGGIRRSFDLEARCPTIGAAQWQCLRAGYVRWVSNPGCRADRLGGCNADGPAARCRVLRGLPDGEPPPPPPPSPGATRVQLPRHCRDSTVALQRASTWPGNPTPHKLDTRRKTDIYQSEASGQQ
jgi:hypothetical protein